MGSEDSDEDMIDTCEAATADRTLVARFKAGDQSAFDTIIERYRGLIYNRAFSLLKNRQDAEEVTNDTFIRAHRGLENFRGDSALSTWMYQIATNLARNRYWYWFRRKRDQSFSIDAPIQFDGESTFVDVLPSEDEDPKEEVLPREFVNRVSEVMKGLRQDHREILVLRNQEGLSYEEIADRLGLTLGTVKSRISRAREHLRELMGSEFDL